MGSVICDALHECEIRKCPPALSRFKFRRTIDLYDAFAKGGKKDRNEGIGPDGANQVAFLTWLCTVTDEFVQVLIAHADEIRLSPFEIASMNDLQWFQFLCKRSQSPENYPDVFHLWSAERNGMDALLTLDNALARLVARVRAEKRKAIEIHTQVLRPLELLEKFGIHQPDTVPMELGRFYYIHELD